MQTDNQPNMPAVTGGPPRCDDIQDALMAFLDGELGAGRADLVREHLRQCPACQTECAALQRAATALRGAAPSAGAPTERLSDERRERVRWSLAHPVLDWIYAHHVLVSAVTAVVAVILIIAFLRALQPAWLKWGRPGPEITIGQGPAPKPETVDTTASDGD